MFVCVRKNSKYISRILFSKSGSVSGEFFYNMRKAYQMYTNGLRFFFVSNKNLINLKMEKIQVKKRTIMAAQEHIIDFPLKQASPKSLSHSITKMSKIQCCFVRLCVYKQIVCFWGATFPVLIHFFGQHYLRRKSSGLTSKINFNLIAASHKQTRKKTFKLKISNAVEQ